MDSANSNKTISFKMDHDWQSGKTLGECNLEMLQNKILSDVTFLVGKKRQPIKAHRYVLACRSSAFFSTFCGDKPIDPMIIVNDVEPAVFNMLLRYIYSDEIEELTSDVVTPLFYAAKKYAVGGLVRACVHVLAAGIDTEGACLILEQAHQFNETDLQTQCLEYIFQHAHAVFKSQSFLDLCTRCLCKVLESDNLRADEARVFEAVCNWSSQACRRNKLPTDDDNKNRMIGNLKYLIRFPVMDIDYFTKNVSNHGMLSKDEKINLFQYLHSRTAPEVAPFKTTRRSLTRALRFESISGSWSVGTFSDAIQFQTSRDIILDGVVVFGCVSGRAQYDVAVKILDGRNNMIAKQDVIVETEASGDMYDITLDTGLKLAAQTWYTVVIRMEGPHTKRGVKGRDMVYCEQIQFLFKTSSQAKNYTTEREGQIPGLLFHD